MTQNPLPKSVCERCKGYNFLWSEKGLWGASESGSYFQYHPVQVPCPSCQSRQEIHLDCFCVNKREHEIRGGKGCEKPKPCNPQQDQSEDEDSLKVLYKVSPTIRAAVEALIAEARADERKKVIQEAVKAIASQLLPDTWKASEMAAVHARYITAIRRLSNKE